MDIEPLLQEIHDIPQYVIWYIEIVEILKVVYKIESVVNWILNWIYEDCLNWCRIVEFTDNGRKFLYINDIEMFLRSLLSTNFQKQFR